MVVIWEKISSVPMHCAVPDIWQWLLFQVPSRISGTRDFKCRWNEFSFKSPQNVRMTSKSQIAQLATKESFFAEHTLDNHKSHLLLPQTQVLSRMSAVCGVCHEAKPIVCIEHSNNANPTVWAVAPGHQICSDCALNLEVDQRPRPFCRISHDKWRADYNKTTPIRVKGLAYLLEEKKERRKKRRWKLDVKTSSVYSCRHNSYT